MTTVERSQRQREKPVTYVAAHARCRRQWGAAKQYDCVTGCGQKANEWAYDGTDPTEIYGRSSKGMGRWSRFPEFYMPMCWRCHRIKDKKLTAQELEEYREWKSRTGLTLKGLDVWFLDTRTLTSDGSEN